MDRPRNDLLPPEDLRHAAELLELGDAFFEVDRDWRILRVNGRQELLSGKPRQETVGRTFAEVWPELWPDSHYVREYRRAMHERVPVQFQAYYAPLDLWTGVTAYPVSGGGVAVFFRDITALKRAEESVRAREEAATEQAAELVAVLGAVADGVLVYDTEGRIIRSNAAADRILGYDERLRSMPLQERFGAADWTWLREDGTPMPLEEMPALRAARLGATVHGAILGIRRADRLQWIELGAAPLEVRGAHAGAVVSVTDITERRRAAEALRESERRLQRMIDVNPIGVAQRDTVGGLRYANDAYLKIIHRSREDLQAGRILWEAITAPEYVETERAAMAQASTEGASTVFEKEYLHEDGSRTPVMMAFASMGAPGEVTAFVVDLGEAKRVEAALRASEGRHRAFFQSVMEMAGVHEVVRDPSGAVVDSILREVNDPALVLLGATREYVVGRRLGELLPPEVVRALTAPWARVLETGAPSRYEVVHRGHTLLVSASRMAEDTIAAVADDVTDRKQAETALAASEDGLRRYAAQVEHAPVLVRDLAGRITVWNQGMERLFGWARGDALGRSIEELLRPVFPAPFDEITAKVMREGRWEGELVHHHRNGAELVVASTWVLHLESDGRPSAIIEIDTDITELTRAQDALRQADRRKDEFLGMLSHELRNPLAPIRNALYILDHSDPNGQQARRAKAVASRQVTHLTRLVDDLLDVTRIGRGKIELRRSDLDLGALVRRVADDHRAIMETRRLHLDVSVTAAPLIVNGDETRLAQILGNVLHNAAKFTPGGGRVSVSVAAQDGKAILRVRDTGEGIEPDLLRSIFEPFTQAQQTLARSEGGLGLGLALVRGLVALHGGDVSATSAGPGRGTELVITLPLATRLAAPLARPAAAHAPHLAARHPSRRVLVIDDNRDAADSLADLVATLGHVPEVAYDGFTGLAKAEAEFPDTVLCDIGLPGMDGYEVARRLRARAGEQELQLIAVSGYAQPEDVARASDAGFDGHLPKPADPAALAALLGSENSGAGRPGPPPPPVPQPPRGW